MGKEGSSMKIILIKPLEFFAQFIYGTSPAKN